MTFGIIDVGTNSIHLLLGILGLNGRFHVLLKERDLTRLGAGGLARGRLTGKAMRRAEKVLAGYAATLRRFGVEHVEAVATSAVREAANGLTFTWRIRKRLGLPLRVISGREEARLIYLGVLQAARFSRSTAIISLGGGSVEVMVGDARRLQFAVSRPLGCARLAERFIRHDPAQPEELEALQREVRRAWVPILRALKRHRWQQALGSSATIQQVLMAAHLFSRHGSVKGKRPVIVGRRSLKRLVQWLATSTAAQRTELPGLDPRRQDLALPTGIVLLAWMEGCGIERIQHVPGSLREGLVVDYLIRHHQRRSHQLFEAITDVLSPNGHNGLTGTWRKRIMEGILEQPKS